MTGWRILSQMRALREHQVTMLDAQYLKTRGIYFKELPKGLLMLMRTSKDKFSLLISFIRKFNYFS